MPHILQKRGVRQGFVARRLLVNDAIAALLRALLPTLQQRFNHKLDLPMGIPGAHYGSSQINYTGSNALAARFDHDAALTTTRGTIVAPMVQARSPQTVCKLRCMPPSAGPTAHDLRGMLDAVVMGDAKTDFSQS